MTTNKEDQKAFQFDDFLLEPDEMRLSFKGVAIHLTPKAFDVLTFLVRNPNRLIRKEELMRSVWGDSFVEEANLNVTISMIRKALASFSSSPLIETVAKTGYRFIGDYENDSDEISSQSGKFLTLEHGVPQDDAVAFHKSGMFNSDWNAPHKKAISVSEPEDQPSQTSDAKFRIGPVRILVGLGLILILASSFWFISNSYLASRRVNTPPQKLVAITSSGNIAEVAFSADGKFLAYTKIEKEKQSLWLRNVRTSDSEISLIEATTNEFRGLKFTPDGSQIYYTLKPMNNSILDLYAVPVLGGMPKLIAHDVDSPPAFSPDGKRFAFMRRNTQSGVTTLLTSSADGSDVAELAFRAAPASYMLKPLDWSPDGKRILCVGTDSSQERKRILIEVEVATGNERPIGNQVWDTFDSVAWAQDGRAIYFSASDVETPLRRQLWFRTYPEGTATEILTDLYDYSTVSVARETNEVIVLHSQAESSVWLSKPGSKETPRRLPVNPTAGQHGLALTRNNQIIFTDGLNGINSLHIARLDLAGNTELTAPRKSVYRFPLITADGESIVFVSAETGIKNIWKMRMDGTEKVQLTFGKSDDEFPALSPDGKWVFYNTISSGQSSLWKVPIEGGEPIRVTEVISLRPQISPDGKKIACYYRSGPKADWQLAILPTDRDEVLQTLALPKSVRLTSPFRWTRDGQALYVIDRSTGTDNIARLNLSSAELTSVTNYSDDAFPNIYNFDVRESDQMFAVARGREVRNAVMLVTN